MKVLKNIILMLAFTSVLFSCQKEIIKPINQANSEKAVVVGYDDNGNPHYKDVTDPDEDDDFEGVKSNQN
jgi:hypothetical protein